MGLTVTCLLSHLPHGSPLTCWPIKVLHSLETGTGPVAPAGPLRTFGAGEITMICMKEKLTLFLTLWAPRNQVNLEILGGTLASPWEWSTWEWSPLRGKQSQFLEEERAGSWCHLLNLQIHLTLKPESLSLDFIFKSTFLVNTLT